MGYMGNGAMNDFLPHMRMRSSEIGDSLARDKIERRTLMASRNGVRYAIASKVYRVCILGKGDRYVDGKALDS